MRLIDVNAFLARDEQREEPIAEDREGCASHERDILKELNDGETEYAILSHRWGDEVNYIEMSELMGFRVEDRDKIQRRDGYRKILNGCKQAERDGIEWLWVDTCCIDKRSSSELSEAINSMYRWYEDAKICYAYLHDVDVESFPTEPNGKTFPKSDGWPEWFSRGWTLQELIAPRQLQFFNRDWESIGMKGELARNLNRITRVPEAILVNGLTSFRPCTAQIMSWAANRKTTRVEDRAYSLLGLLDVNMAMLYGEGKNAFHRLQLEIIHKSNDQSIFAWGHGKGGIRSVLADDPSLFRDCHNVVEMDRDEFDIHLQERLRGTAARSVPLPKKRGSFSVTNQGIQIWLPIVPYDFTDTLSRATLACCRWDRKPITIDLALWGSNYYRSPSTRNMPNVIPQFHKIYLSHQSKAYPDIKFELGGKDGIHNTLCSRGFTLLGSFPGDMTHVVWTSDRYDRFFRVLSGINALAISVYEQGRSPRTRLAVVFGCFLGHPWVRVTQDRREGSWKQYAEKVYNQMWTAGTHIARSSFPNNTHVHLDWPDWVGWTVQLTQSRCNTSIESTSSQVDITLSQCTAKQCDGQKGWDVGVSLCFQRV
ncbi:heterokaryon incompatibility protein-domain-containing protein [Scleroderma yunnanense]